MLDSSLQGALEVLPTGGALELTLDEIPLDEVLFTLHTGRFTGAMRVTADSGFDRVFFREGAVVGVVPPEAEDAGELARLIVQMKLLSEEAMAALWEDSRPKDGVALARVLVESGVLDSAAVTRAAEEHARRRVFSLYEARTASVDLRSGLDSLAHFVPIHLDVRPTIAFGVVVQMDEARKAEMKRRVLGRTARLLAPYDERRNSYGLPPPVLVALRDLAEGVRFLGEVKLPGLSSSETAGVLVLFARMSLLQID